LVKYSDQYRSKGDVEESPEYKAVVQRVIGGDVDGKNAKLLLAVAEARGKAKPDAEDTKLVERVTADDADSNMLLKTFVETVYFPEIEGEDSKLRGKTVSEYKSMWTRYGIGDSVGGLRVVDFKTKHGKELLKDIADKHDVSTRTIQHVKFLLMGIFRSAKNSGLLDGKSSNPMKEVELPKTKGSRPTHAYSKDEVLAMLSLPFDTKAKAAIGVAAFAGLRESEIAGLHWEDYDGETITVRRSIDRVNGEANETKTQASAAPVPLIEPLKVLLDKYKATVPLLPNGEPIPDKAIFPGIRQTYCDLDKLALRVIRPILEAAGLKWHGWHAFRRGLATLLNDLGVPLLTIQAILRHGDPRVTEKAYVKRLPKQSVEAMAKVAAAFSDVRPESATNGSATMMVSDDLIESVR
jgi:integrase